MERDHELSQGIHAQNERQRGWEHIPSNANDEIVSPVSSFSPANTGYDPSQFQRISEPEPHTPGDAAALSDKRPKGPYEEAIPNDAAPRLKRRRFLSEWWQEMLSAVLSMLCVVAIVVILFKVNGKPLEEWNEPVSLNAVISVLSTAVKAGLILPVAECISQLKWIHLQSSKSHLEQLQVFDNASRGPAGSFQFFWQAKKAPLVSYFACLIVILAVALDPFTQQIVRYQAFEMPIPHTNSTVPHLQAYDKGGAYGTTYETRRNDNITMFGMMSGLYGSLPLPPFSCPGANCTYPVVNTLGMCSSCEDVTERTVADCVDWPWSKIYYSDRESRCNYTLPGGSSLTASEHQTTYGLNYPTLNTSTTEEPNLYPLSTKTNLIVNMSNIPTLYNMNIIRFDSAEDLGAENPRGMSGTGNGSDWMATMSAHECVFELCAWSFSNWSHVDGNLKEGSVAQSRLRPRDELAEFFFNQDTFQYPAFVFQTLDTDFPGNQTYTLGNEERSAMVQTFNTMWNTAEGNDAAAYLTSSLYLADRDIPRTLDAMAKGITIKMMSASNATLSLGQVFKTQTFITVRWEWLTLSIITVLGSVALLAATIVKTCRAHQRAWKSSLVPLLYADSTMVPAENVRREWDEEDKAQRKAVISTSLLAASAVGTTSALS